LVSRHFSDLYVTVDRVKKSTNADSIVTVVFWCE
jgi:hypothetical protein